MIRAHPPEVHLQLVQLPSPLFVLGSCESGNISLLLPNDLQLILVLRLLQGCLTTARLLAIVSFPFSSSQLVSCAIFIVEGVRPN